MAMWRDPLDELIADLERSMPAATTPAFEMPPPMEDVCVFGESLFSRDPAERLLLAEDPRVKRVCVYYERLGRAWNRSDAVERKASPATES